MKTLMMRAGLLLLCAFLILPGVVLAQGGTTPITSQNAASAVELARFGRGTVSVAAYAPDGATVALGGALGVWLYNATDFSADPVLLAGHSAPVTALAFSPDGALLASGGEDQAILLWNVASGDVVQTLARHEDAITGLAFNPAGDVLASGSRDDTVRQWDVASGLEVRSLPHERSVNAVAYGPDGTLVSADSEGLVTLWDAATAMPVASFNAEAQVSTLAFNGSTVAAGGSSSTLVLWDAASQEVTWRNVENTGPIRALVFGGEALLYFGSRMAGALNPANGAVLADWSGIFGEPVLSAALRADGADMITVSDSSGVIRWQVIGDGEPPALWEVASPFIAEATRAHADSVQAVRFSPAGDAVLAVNSAEQVQLWDIAAGSQAAHITTSLPTLGVQSPAAFNPAGDGSFAVLDASLGVNLFNAAGESAGTLGQYDGEVTAFAYSPDGSLLASAEESGVIVVWEVASQGRVAVLVGHVGAVNQLAFNAAGALIASAADDGTVRLWGVPGE